MWIITISSDPAVYVFSLLVELLIVARSRQFRIVRKAWRTAFVCTAERHLLSHPKVGAGVMLFMAMVAMVHS